VSEPPATEPFLMRVAKKMQDFGENLGTEKKVDKYLGESSKAHRKEVGLCLAGVESRPQAKNPSNVTGEPARSRGGNPPISTARDGPAFERL
jgi:hypothetical protein